MKEEDFKQPLFSVVTVDTIFTSAGKLTARQILCLAILALLRFNLALDYASYVFIGRHVRFECVSFDEKTGINITMVDACPDNDVDKCESIRFDGKTFGAQFNLVCNRFHLLPMPMSFMQFGFAIGMPLMGVLTDRIGRLAVLKLILCGSILSNALSVAWINYPWFVFIRFFCGFLVAGSTACQGILTNELISSQYRGIAAAIFSSGWAGGIASVSVLAYFIRDWIDLIFWIGVSGLPLFLTFFAMTESPHWLVSQNRIEDANRVLKILLKGRKIEVLEEKDTNGISSKEQIRGEEDHSAPSIKELFKEPKFVSFFVVEVILWAIIIIGYFNLTLAQGSAKGDSLYWGMAVNGMVELPGDFIGGLLIARIGRKPTITGGFILCSICSVANYFTPHKPNTNTFLISAAKMSISAVFAMSIVHTTEILPTSCRSTFLGLVFMVSNCIAGVGPYLVATTYHFLILACMMIFAPVAVCVMLPETKDKNLPQNAKEMLKML